jgi:primosomal protein N' (replication factor Y)
MLAKMSNANIVLGSATPSIESWVNAKKNIYSLVELTERYGSVSLPEVEIIDIKQETFRKKMIGPLSTQLFNAISKAIKQNRQAILFQNRRGYSTWIECASCGWMPFCKNCDVSMTYHKNINTLKCHYCGFIEKIPDKCPSCKSTQIIMKGLGTQRVEDELGIIFPDAKIARMDFDSVKGKKAAKELFKGFDEGKFQILVGTQMVTKGLDFSRVDIVGILNADNLHAFPDYRAHEQAFQTMMQVAGRAGRRDNEGKTFIQVYNKENPIVQFVANADYVGFIEKELKSRHSFRYPPFVRLIKISVLHKEKSKCEEVSKILKEKLKKHFPNYQILGPEYPIVPRIRNFYIRDILLKLLKNKELPNLKNNIQKEIKNLNDNEISKGIRFIIDVDPL